MKPHGTLVEHTFDKTTIIGNHTFFKGKTTISEDLLDQHEAEVEAEEERQAAALASEGKTAGELLGDKKPTNAKSAK